MDWINSVLFVMYVWLFGKILNKPCIIHISVTCWTRFLRAFAGEARHTLRPRLIGGAACFGGDRRLETIDCSDRDMKCTRTTPVYYILYICVNKFSPFISARWDRLRYNHYLINQLVCVCVVGQLITHTTLCKSQHTRPILRWTLSLHSLVEYPVNKQAITSRAKCHELFSDLTPVCHAWKNERDQTPPVAPLWSNW